MTTDMTPPTAPERCPTCDREACPKLLPAEHTEECRSDCPRCVAIDDCHAHRVDWRARDIAAEADAQQWRNAVDGSQEPGDPVIRAIAALLACTYLDKLPTPPDDDFRRELAVAARIAHDKRRAAAAQWAKVAPLIERLRAAVGSRDVYRSPYDLIDAVHFILAATEATP